MFFVKSEKKRKIHILEHWCYVDNKKVCRSPTHMGMLKQPHPQKVPLPLGMDLDLHLTHASEFTPRTAFRSVQTCWQGLRLCPTARGTSVTTGRK